MTDKLMSGADNYLPLTNQQLEEYRYILLHSFDNGGSKVKGGKSFGKRSVDLFSIIQSAIDNQNVGTTNLSYDDGTIVNDSGSDAIIPDATELIKGLMTAAFVAKLNGIEPNATADQTALEIVTAINNQLGNTIWQTGGNSFPFYNSGKAHIRGKTGSVTYTTNGNGLGTLLITSIQEIAHASIIIEPAIDGDGNNSFDLVIDDQSDSINTFNPSADALTVHDLYVPAYRILDIGSTVLNQTTMEDDSLAAQPIVPTFNFGGGRLTFEFNGNQTFGSKTRLLLQLNFG